MMNDSQKAYERHALEYLRCRDKSLIGSEIVERWAKNLPEGGEGIEFACGGGFPITHTLDGAGIKLWAVDGSPTLVEKFRNRFPHIPIQCARVQTSECFNRKFDIAVSVGLIFLLSEADQINFVTKVSEVLIPGGRFLLTAPLEIGTWIDENTGIECRSLGLTQYEEIFQSVGFRLITTYMDKGENNYYDLMLSI